MELLGEAKPADRRATGSERAHERKGELLTSEAKWRPFEVDSLVADVLAEEGPIQQWAATGGVASERLSRRVLDEDPLSFAVQERADLAEAEAELKSLRQEQPGRTNWIVSARPTLLDSTRLVVILVSLAAAVAALAQAELWNSEGGLLALSLIPLAAATAALLAVTVRRRSKSHAMSRHATNVAEAEDAVNARTSALRDALLTGCVRPALFTMANENRGDLFRTTLRQVKHEGLAELARSSTPINTDAKRRLERLLREMPGGSIGLAGPRGAGKSTLIRAACPSARRGPIFGVMVAAPVEFNARDFILHLFAELCQTVLGTDQVDDMRRPDPVDRAIGDRRTLIWLAVAGSLLVVGAGALLVVYGSIQPRSRVNWDLIAGIALIVLGTIGYAGFYREQLLKRARGGGWPGEAAEELARDRLRDIWFQQSYTHGWSGSISVPVGLAVGVEGTTELARRQMSMPDIIAEMRRLIALIVERSDVESVRIGIDELDKIESPADAARFMNEIKVLFGITDCFFLVSVSEDAMSAFERRGLPFRDVFDSSFDDIVRVGHLHADAAIELVQSRVIGMPVPFILLGHCMAGGLARDLIRVVRDIVSMTADGKTVRLSHVCRELQHADVCGKAEAAVVACRRFPPSESTERLQSWLRAATSVDITASGLLKLCEQAGVELSFLRGACPEDVQGGTAAGLATEFLAFSYFSATLLEFFGSRRASQAFRVVVEPRGGRPPIDRLAGARQAFAVHPRAAWDAVDGFRQKQRLGTRLPFPQLA